MRSHKWRTLDNSAAYLAPHLTSGASLLDLGCGPGTICMIALSGYAGQDLRDACLAEGFDAYLTKPGSIPELEQLIGGDRVDSGGSTHA